jgi:hypothetical protein
MQQVASDSRFIVGQVPESSHDEALPPYSLERSS